MYFFIIFLSVLLLDQGLKLLVDNTLEPYSSIPVLDNIFHITYVQNKGAAFGILQNKTLFFIVVTIIVCIVILFIYFKTRNTIKFGLFHFSLALQLGGAIGNLIDRVRLGYVIDFLDFRIWPVFNIADITIVLGVILLSWVLLVTPEEKLDKR